MSKEYDLAVGILNAVGNKENIADATYCMTRLRLTLKDPRQADKDKIKTIDGVLGLVEAGKQLQIILGPGVVTKVANEVTRLTGLKMGEVQDLKAQIDDKNRTPFKLFLRKVSNIFIPLIPAIVGSGTIGGITNFAIQAGADPKSTVIALLNAIGMGLFSYLAILVGINAAKEFGGTPAMGAVAAVLLINPVIANITVYGAHLVPGRGGIIGVLLVAWFMSWVEKRVRRFVPNAIDTIGTPTITLLITGFATYYVLMPIGGWLSDGIVSIVRALLSLNGPLSAISGFILAGTFLPLVTTGLHQGLTPIHLELLNKLKADALLPILAMGGAGQVGAAFAVYFKTKNKKLKNIIKGGLPVGMLGIGEPLIYGVTLPLGRPFFTACIGAAFGGAYEALMHTATMGIGVSGLPLTFLVKSGGVVNYLIGLLISYIVGFIATYLIGFNDPVENE
jgi:PTS system sucrose-specific IIC component